jgi:hypothetical protein
MANNNTNQKTQPHLVWELVRLAPASEVVVCSVEQTVEEHETNGRGDALANLLPVELIDSANAGEWNEEGLLFEHDGETFLVRCRVTAREEIEEIVHDPIPEPLSLGVGVSIDVVSDHMDSPTWYVGIYDDETADWLGEVPTRMDPMRVPLAAIDELAEAVARYILHVYPRCVVGTEELARRIRMVIRTARVGAPRSYPEIEREGVE